MRLLLDSHVLLWWLGEPHVLKKPAVRAITDPASQVWVSAASIWEIAIKKQLGKVKAPDSLAAIDQDNFLPLPVTHEHAWAAGALPRHHDDPFDRMLIAQAIAHDLAIVTRDASIARYDVKTLRA